MKKAIFLLLTSLIINIPALTASAEESTSQQSFTQAELEQMLAPIALYPDSVLTHILIASTYPLEVVQANRLIEKNPNLTAEKATKIAQDKDWDVSVKALMPFPRILNRLSEELEWTQNLGEAFLQNEQQVLDSVQSLRYKAKQAGNLDQIENMEISQEDNNIVIQPTKREYVYIPYYDPRVVYGSWHWRHHPPVCWTSRYHSRHYLHNHRFGWYPSVHLSSFDFFFSTFHWHNRHVIRLGHHHYNHHRHYHRAHIVRHARAERWRHNLHHRRGVAYRTESVRQRFPKSSLRKPRLQRKTLNSVKSNRKIRQANGVKPNSNIKRVRSSETIKKSGLKNKPMIQNNRINKGNRVNKSSTVKTISLNNQKPSAYKIKRPKQTKQVQYTQPKKLKSTQPKKRVQKKVRVQKRVQPRSSHPKRNPRLKVKG